MISPNSKPFVKSHQRFASTGNWCHSTQPFLLNNIEIKENSVVLDRWMVVNKSTDHMAHKITNPNSNIIRVDAQIALYCQTELVPSTLNSVDKDLSNLKRNQIQTRLVYLSNVNPGGWVPASALRALARREYPRFLKRFGQYVSNETKDKSLLF